MMCDMIAKAIRAGINAEYFLIDVWFATKHILKMKCRIVMNDASHLLCAKELYKQRDKGRLHTVNNIHYQSKSIVVELNLTRLDKEPAQQVKVKLLFVHSRVSIAGSI